MLQNVKVLHLHQSSLFKMIEENLYFESEIIYDHYFSLPNKETFVAEETGHFQVKFGQEESKCCHFTDPKMTCSVFQLHFKLVLSATLIYLELSCSFTKKLKIQFREKRTTSPYCVPTCCRTHAVWEGGGDC